MGVGEQGYQVDEERVKWEQAGYEEPAKAGVQPYVGSRITVTCNMNGNDLIHQSLAYAYCIEL